VGLEEGKKGLEKVLVSEYRFGELRL